MEEVKEEIGRAPAKSLEWSSKIPVGISYVNPYTDIFEERLARRIPLYAVKNPRVGRL